MDDASGVRRVECIRHLNAEILGWSQFQRLTFDRLLQNSTFKVLHGDERSSFVFSHFIDGADIRMIECRGRARFTLEAL